MWYCFSVCLCCPLLLRFCSISFQDECGSFLRLFVDVLISTWSVCPRPQSLLALHAITAPWHHLHSSLALASLAFDVASYCLASSLLGFVRSASSRFASCIRGPACLTRRASRRVGFLFPHAFPRAGRVSDHRCIAVFLVTPLRHQRSSTAG
jgi:hypothetical protein